MDKIGSQVLMWIAVSLGVRSGRSWFEIWNNPRFVCRWLCCGEMSSLFTRLGSINDKRYSVSGNRVRFVRPKSSRTLRYAVNWIWFPFHLSHESQPPPNRVKWEAEYKTKKPEFFFRLLIFALFLDKSCWWYLQRKQKVAPVLELVSEIVVTCHNE
jgi:hypothetical protein